LCAVHGAVHVNIAFLRIFGITTNQNPIKFRSELNRYVYPPCDCPIAKAPNLEKVGVGEKEKLETPANVRRTFVEILPN
jgi:hypothetical protein